VERFLGPKKRNGEIKMKVFILEDDPSRIEWFKTALANEDLDITEDVEEAMKWLRETKYDAIFLDHDLGGEQMVSSDVWNTGSTVARMIHETENKDLMVIIHSWNPTGARIMLDSLRDNGVTAHYCAFMTKEFLEVTKQFKV
jgi:CheY-like chemotaxis protein